MPILVTAPMRPPLRKRLGFADRGIEARTDRATMARVLMYASAAGGVISLAALAAASPVQLARVAVSAASAWGAAALLLAWYADTPRALFPALVLGGTALVLWTIAAGGSAYAVMLALPVAYSVHFFSKPEAAGAVLAAVGGYVALAGAGGSEVAVTAV